MYKSLTEWRDLEDGHLYRTGDNYPHDGREVSEERIAGLSSKQNGAGFALIKAAEAPAETKPTEEPKPTRKVAKTRKKAD